jgi:dolichyl-phosphate beta-glucosyltransferase
LTAGAGTTALSIVIPAYNEAGILEQILSELHARFPAAELVLVNDGGRDNTRGVIESLDFTVTYLEHQPNRGKGFSIKRGVLEARGALIVFTDADLPFGTEGVGAIVESLSEGVDVAIAEKRGENKRLGYRAARAAIRPLVRLLTGVTFADTQAGLKGFKRGAAHAIFGRTVVEGFATDIEMLYLALRNNLEVKSVPLPLTDVYVRPSTFTVRKALRLLFDIGRIRFTPYETELWQPNDT